MTPSLNRSRLSWTQSVFSTTFPPSLDWLWCLHPVTASGYYLSPSAKPRASFVHSLCPGLCSFALSELISLKKYSILLIRRDITLFLADGFYYCSSLEKIKYHFHPDRVSFWLAPVRKQEQIRSVCSRGFCEPQTPRRSTKNVPYKSFLKSLVFCLYTTLTKSRYAFFIEPRSYLTWTELSSLRSLSASALRIETEYQ